MNTNAVIFGFKDVNIRLEAEIKVLAADLLYAACIVNAHFNCEPTSSCPLFEWIL